MDGDTGFAFDFKTSETSDPTMSSWGDMFLDSIHSDEPPSGEASSAAITDSGLGPPLDNASQSNSGGPLLRLARSESQQIISDTLANIPTHLQASVPNNSANNSIVQLPQQSNTSSSSITPIAYLNPSAVTRQQQPQPQAQFKPVGNIQNVLSANTNQQQQQTVSQGNTKLVQIAPSIPVATVQQLANNVPLQTLLQPNQALATGQTMYSNQNQGLFPQGSVHIENPKVVNVNFGPHVIQQDGSGQPAIIQTAEGKRVLITNQLQGLPQSISLTQPIMGTHLINAGASVNHVIRTTMAQAAPALVPSSNSTNPRQIVLPRQPVTQQVTAASATGFSKNVVLRQINPSVQSVIYQGGQNNVAGQLIQSPQTLIASSGTGLQVVSAGANNQGNQVQLIAQPSINQTTMGGQQINQNALMNLINNQGMLQPNTTNQLSGLVSGQNILVNGQMININQLGGLAAAIPQLQVQANANNGGVADTTTVPGIANRNQGQYQPATAANQVFISQQQQQQLLIQPKPNTPSPSLLSSDGSQKLSTNFQGKTNILGTPLHNTNSASSTPALTPTPSTPTPTPTPTPDAVFDDFCGGGGKVSNHSNIIEQALKMSSIDFDSIEGDDFFLPDPVGDCNITSNSLSNSNMSNTMGSVIIPAPAPTPPKPTISPAPLPKAKPASKSKSKATKSKQNKQTQPIVNVTVHNNLNRINNSNNTNSSTTSQVPNASPAAPSVNTSNGQGQKVSLSPQIITPTGQVYVLSADGQQLVLQQTSGSPLMTTNPNSKPSNVQQNASSPSTTTIPRPNIHIPATGQGQAQQARLNKSSASPADIVNNRIKSQIPAANANQTLKTDNVNNSPAGQKAFHLTAATSANPVQQQTGSHVFVKAGMASLKSSVVPVSSSQSLPQVSPSLSSPTHFVQVKNQQISTLAGKFIKQEPLAVVKQEPPDVKPAFSFFDPPIKTTSSSISNNGGNSSSSIVSSQSLSLSSSVYSTNASSHSISNSVISPLSVVSVSSSTVATTSHNTSIMSAATATLSSQSNLSPGLTSTSLSSFRTNATVSSSLSSDAVSLTSTNAHHSLQPSIPPIVSSQQIPISSARGARKNVKSKEPANMKSLTQIKIANSTLTLSLTPGEKENFEKDVSSMSMEKQAELLSHQQHVIRWSQEKQLKQKQQQQQQQFQGNNGGPAPSGPTPTLMMENKVTAGISGHHQQSTPPAVVAASSNNATTPTTPTPKSRKVVVTAAGTAPVAPVNASALPTTIQELEEKPIVPPETQHQSTMEKSWQQQQQQNQQLQQQQQNQQLQQQQNQQLQQQQQRHIPQQDVPSFRSGHVPSAAVPSLSTSTQPQAQAVHSQMPQFAVYQTVGRSLAEQQLSRDCCLALGPDTSTTFKSLSDAMRRLVRFHTLQDHKPEEGSKEMKIWDSKYAKVCEQLVQRKRRFMRRFSKLMVYQENIAHRNHPENLQNLKCLNENIRETLTRQKEEAISHPESFQRYLAESQMASSSTPVRESSPENDVADSSSEPEEQEESEEEEEESEREEDEDDDDDDEERSYCDDSRSYRQSYYSELSTDVAHVKQEIKIEPSSSPSPHSTSATSVSFSKTSSSGLKRKHEETTSSGTLKLVFKRRNTDHQSFTIKTSNVDSVSKDLKPVVNMERSDSLYEFDAKSKGASSKSSTVVVKRRESFVSRQTSSDNRSVVSLDSSYSDDEEMEDDNDHSGQGGDYEGNSVEYSMTDDDDSSKCENEKGVSDCEGFKPYGNGKKHHEEEVKMEIPSTSPPSPVHRRHRSNPSSSYLNSNSSEDTKVDLKDNRLPVSNHHQRFSSEWDKTLHVEKYESPEQQHQGLKQELRHSSSCKIEPGVRYSDISAPETISGNSSLGSKKSDTTISEGTRQLLRMQHMSTASDEVFTPGNQEFPSAADGEYQSPKTTSRHNSSLLERNCSVENDLSLRMRSSSTHTPEHDSSDQHQLSKYATKTPTRPTIPHLVSNASSDLFPSNVLFATPNKSLLQTDAMFNSSSEDEEDVENNLTSTFKIDNRDPQSSMVSDSVQTIINSVINNDDDDDDVVITGNNRQRGGSSSRHGWIPPSSNSQPPRRPFFPTSSLSSSVHEDEDLDAAVQSILNNNPPRS